MISLQRVAISIDDGRAVRDLFYNGLLDLLVARDIEVTIFTEAITVPDFVQTWSRPGVQFARLWPCTFDRKRLYAFHLRRRLMRWNRPALLERYLALEERQLYPLRAEYARFFRDQRPDLMVATNVLSVREAELISAAHQLKVPTLGLVRSWDNVHKGLQGRPQQLAVWNEINRQEVIDFDRYQPDRVTIIGPTQFDPYFAADTLWPREQLAARFGLDARRPIILFGTLGYFIPGLDETCWMDILLEQIDQGAIPGNPQVICRLHPWSRFEHFKRYADRPDVRLSYVDRYWPTLTWYMTRADMVLMANLLQHADVVITPGSTLTLEAAIFDTPTVVPIFHTYQPERGRDYFAKVVLGKHFRRIEQLDLAPIVCQPEEYIPAINHCLVEPTWYRTQRAQLVREYVHFTDGRSVERLADLMVRLVGVRAS